MQNAQWIHVPPPHPKDILCPMKLSSWLQTQWYIYLYMYDIKKKMEARFPLETESHLLTLKVSKMLGCKLKELVNATTIGNLGGKSIMASYGELCVTHGDASKCQILALK